MAISKINLCSVFGFLIVIFVTLVLADASCQTETRVERARLVDTEKRLARDTRRETDERNGGERRFRRDERREERFDREARRGERRVVQEREEGRRDQRRMIERVDERRRDSRERMDRRVRRDDERRIDFRREIDSVRGEKEMESSFSDNRIEKTQDNSSWEKMSLSLLIGIVGYTLMTPVKTID